MLIQKEACCLLVVKVQGTVLGREASTFKDHIDQETQRLSINKNVAISGATWTVQVVKSSLVDAYNGGLIQEA